MRKYKQAAAVLAAVCGALLCGFFVLRILLPMVLYRTAGEVIVFPAASQSYDLTNEVIETDLLRARADRYFRQGRDLYQEVFGVPLEEEDQTSATYSGNWYEGYTIYLEWAAWRDDWRDGSEESYRIYDARLQQPATSNDAVLTELSYWGDVYSGMFDGYAAEAKDRIAGELGRNIPDACQMTIRVAYLCQQDDIQITISWQPETYDEAFGEGAPFSYYTVYGDCDLKQGTGQIKSLGVDATFRAYSPVLFTPAERAAAIQALRELAGDKQIRLGDVLEEKALSFAEQQSAMSIAFALQDDETRVIRFTVGADGTLFGYEYQPREQ